MYRINKRKPLNYTFLTWDRHIFHIFSNNGFHVWWHLGSLTLMIYTEIGLSFIMATHTCQCIPFWPKKSFILSLNICGRYCIAQSMIIITSLPFMLFRRSNLASSWLIVLNMWDLQSSICLVDISRSWRKASWSSGQVDKMANRTSSTISPSSKHLSHSF